MRSGGRKARRLWIGAFSALALAVIVGTAFYHRREHEQARANAYREIASISRLKAEQISRWRTERLSDVQVAADSPFVQNVVQAWMGGSAPQTDLKADLEVWLALKMGDDLYVEALLLDPKGRVLLSTRRTPDKTVAQTLKAVGQAISTGRELLSDIYQGPDGGIYLDALAPLAARSGRVIALVDLRIDARSYLFRLVQSWPTQSPSAETLLVSREGDNVLFLTQPRHRSGAALSFLLPLSRSETPAVQAVLGRQGMFEGKDYQGMEVLADIRPVPESPWFIVSKIDASEVYTEARYRALISFLIAMLLIFLVGAGTAFGLRHRQVQLSMSLLTAERKEKELQEEFRTTLYSIGDAVIGTDTDGVLWHMNPEAERLTGWKETEARGRKLEEVFRIISEDTRQAVECPVQRVLREGGVVGLANHTLLVARDGKELPIADSGAPISDGDGSPKGVVLVFRDQSEERAARKALEASEERYRSLVENMEVGIASADPLETFTFANSAAERVFGVPRGTLAGRSLGEFLSDAEFARVQKETARRASGERSTYQITIRRADGQQRQVMLTGIPQLDAEGKFAGTFGTLQDITDKCRAEEELARERALLQTLMDNGPDHIYFKDRRGRFILANRALARVLGASGPSELIGKTDFDFFSPEHAESAFEDEQRVMKSGQPVIDIEERETWPDRPDTWVSTTKMPLANEKGEIVGTFGVSRDITERRKMEESLRESEEHYRNTFMNAPFGVFHSTTDGRIISANEAFARMMGYETPEELIETVNRRGVAEVLYEHPERRPALVGELLRTGGWQRFSNTYRRKDGKIVSAILTMRPYARQEGSATELEGFVEDVTEREKLQEQLLQAQKMEAVGRLAGGIAHDFNNILTVIYGYCDLGLDGTSQREPFRGFFQQIRESASRASNLTSQLLSFSRRRILQPRTIDLGDLVAGLMDMLRRVLGEDIDVHDHRQAGLWNVRADPGQIEQVIMNLAVNSRDAMPRGGVLTIETANVRLDEGYVLRHAEVKAGEYVVLAVSDTGHGMDAATLDRIYEPFFTTKEVGKGTGLGLATVYGIVKQSGGNIYCYSEVGRGTTFKIYLPHAEGGPEKAASADVAPVAKRVGEATILFVDDDEAVRTIAVSILMSAGYTVISARNGSEALAALPLMSSTPDLMITDIVMPDLNGIELARRVVEAFAAIRVLYISGYTEDAIVHHGILQEGVELLQKPFTATDLLQKVSGMLEAPPEPASGA